MTQLFEELMFSWIAACLLGALAPALILAGLSENLNVLPIAFIVTLAHCILLGVPVAIWFRSRQWKRLGATLVGAGLIGAIPLGIFSMSTTSAGWVDYLESLAMLGSLGAVGGLVFWLTM